MSEVSENTVIIKGARLAFADLWAAKEFKPGDGKPRYSATLLLPKNDPQLATIIALGRKMFVGEFKDKGAALFDSNLYDRQLCCLQDGDKKVFDGFPGNIALVAHRKVEAGAPLVKSRDMKSDLKPADGKPYNGCYVNAKVSFWVQDNSNGKAFRCSPEVVQFVRDGEAFTGIGPASTDGMEAEPEEEAASMV